MFKFLIVFSFLFLAGCNNQLGLNKIDTAIQSGISSEFLWDTFLNSKYNEPLDIQLSEKSFYFNNSKHKIHFINDKTFQILSDDKDIHGLYELNGSVLTLYPDLESQHLDFYFSKNVQEYSLIIDSYLISGPSDALKIVSITYFVYGNLHMKTLFSYYKGS